jgi:hypothetical protein
MTPIKWVAPNEFYDHNRKPEGGGGDVPVLTLDQIKAWIFVQVPKLGNKAEYLLGYSDCINDLLAQVQAWKEKP